MSTLLGFLPALILITALGCGLMAGVFFAFSNFVMQALRELPHPYGVRAMQAINRHVLNSGFMLVFMGTALLCLILLGVAWWQTIAGAAYVVGGALLYLLGVFGITAAGNVPLNERLAKNEAEAFWREYLQRWMMWNHLRTLAAGMAMLCFILAR